VPAFSRNVDCRVTRLDPDDIMSSIPTASLDSRALRAVHCTTLYSVSHDDHQRPLTIFIHASRLTIVINRWLRLSDIHDQWNSLPHDIVASDTLSHFRRGLKTFLFRQSYPSILF